MNFHISPDKSNTTVSCYCGAAASVHKCWCLQSKKSHRAERLRPDANATHSVMITTQRWTPWNRHVMTSTLLDTVALQHCLKMLPMATSTSSSPPSLLLHADSAPPIFSPAGISVIILISHEIQLFHRRPPKVGSRLCYITKRASLRC